MESYGTSADQNTPGLFLQPGSAAPPSIRWNLAPETCWFHISSRLVAMRRSNVPFGCLIVPEHSVARESPEPQDSQPSLRVEKSGKSRKIPEKNKNRPPRRNHQANRTRAAGLADYERISPISSL